ncbi:MAG: hypothetical protein ACTS73_08500 [Arsenophonus sp. NEOnobi-MAG3]
MLSSENRWVSFSLRLAPKFTRALMSARSAGPQTEYCAVINGLIQQQMLNVLAHGWSFWEYRFLPSGIRSLKTGGVPPKKYQQDISLPLS